MEKREQNQKVNEAGIKRYGLSFYAGGLLRRETIRTALLWRELHDWTEVQRQIVEENFLQMKTDGSRRRVYLEIRGRVEQLSDEEIDLFTSGTSQDEDILLWLALCRKNEFLADFSRQVLREKYLTYQSELSFVDYDLFVERISVLHPEVFELKESTGKRLRAGVFCLMRDCSLLSSDNRIRPVSLSNAIIELIKKHNPSEIQFFPTKQKV